MSNSKYFVTRLTVKGLWGHKPYDIKFNPDVNIIIGPNASGKTTIINLLHHALTAQVSALARIVFKELTITLQSFDSLEEERIVVRQVDDHLFFAYGNREVAFPLGPWRLQSAADFTPHPVRRQMVFEMNELKSGLLAHIPAVWLPVSRRLPISDEEEIDRRRLHKQPLESVDECLGELLEGLQRYRTSLDSQLSELRKEFQKHALESVLYDKQHDRFTGIDITPPSEDDRVQLQNAFADLGLVDSKVKKRIAEHFAAADRAAAKVRQDRDGIDLETLFIIPLVSRTRSMVQFAQELKEKRTALFHSLHLFEYIVSSFLVDKSVSVDDRGLLRVTPDRRHNSELDWRHLSSGEKQILILLTQAILFEKHPVIYVADEPELSLHVTWQEKLISSLVSLAGRCQFIVATHSPDIAGGFYDKLIDLSRL